MGNGNRKLVQHINNTMHGHQVGVMNVFEKDGAPVAQVALFDPRSGRESTVMVAADDTLDVGGQRYRVVQLVLAQGDERAWIEIAPDPQLN